MDVQADLSLRKPHMSEDMFLHVAACINILYYGLVIAIFVVDMMLIDHFVYTLK